MGGLSRLSSCDWPGELTATVFLQGCPWRCGYCHNAHLLEPGGGDGPSWAEVTTFLATRIGLLDGVVFSGGEPTSQRGLGSAMAEVRAMGFRVGLHTGGPHPERIEEVIGLVDWVGFDVKAPWHAYERITGVAGSEDRARRSLEALVRSGVGLEVRTTVHPALLSEQDLLDIHAQLKEVNAAGAWVLQPFRAQGCADEGLSAAGDQAVRIPGALAACEIRG